MSDKQSEMSLDDVLQSIKQMVTDKDPPVLDLTDMMSPDGSIVKLKKGFPNNTTDAAEKLPDDNFENKEDFSAFLNLAQANAKMDSQPNKNSGGTSRSKYSTSAEQTSFSENKFQPLEKTIREVATPMIKEWLSSNLERVMKETIREEIHRAIKE